MNFGKRKAGFRWPYHGRKDAAHLLEALEQLRADLGSEGEDIITILREAGVTPPDPLAPDDDDPREV